MNLNYFVVIPNKSPSVKLKARNLPELHLDAVKLDQESKIIENRLQQLRENMSREKEEREKSGGFRWKSVLAASHGPTKIKENGLQKLSAGKVKMRVLKDEPEDASRSLGKAPRPPPKEPAPSTKPRLKGKPCGQCEARTARLMCPECGENYCVGCFARFHQKGALKNHRMIPIQMEIQTSINTLDLVSRFRKQIDPEGSAVRSKRKDPTHSQEAQKSKPPPVILPDAQLLGFDDEETDEEKEVEEEDESEPDERANSPALLRGVFDEEESKRSFQEALREWRRKRGAAQSKPEEEQEPKPELDLVPELKPKQEQKQELELKEDSEPDLELEQAGRPIKAPTASTEVFGTQADFQTRQQPITVEFKEHGLSYMEKLLLKKHRRTPIEEYRPPSFAGSYQELQMDTSRLTDEEGPGLTAEEMEMRRYCASLFATTTTPANSSDQHDHMTQSCLSIVELDEMAGDSAVLNSTFTAELETDNDVLTGAEGMTTIVVQEAGHQETKIIKDPRHSDVPSTPLQRPSLAFNQLPRPLGSQSTTLQSPRATLSSPLRSPQMAPSPGHFTSHLTQSSQVPLLPTSTPPSPLSSRSPLTRVHLSHQLTGSLQLDKSLTGPPRSPLIVRHSPQGSLPSKSVSAGSPPPEVSTRPKSNGLRQLTPPSSGSKLSGSLLQPELLSLAKSTGSPTPPPGLLPRPKSVESSPPTSLTSRSESTGSPPSELSSGSKSAGSLPLELVSRSELTTSPLLELPFFQKSTRSPLPSSGLFPRPKSIESSPLTPLSSRSESPPPELSCQPESTGSPPPELSSRPKSTGSPPPELSSRPKSTGSPPSELSSRPKSTGSPPPELATRPKSTGSFLLELSSRPKSTGSFLLELSSRPKSTGSPPPELSSRPKSNGSPPPELSSRPKSTGSSPLELSSRPKSTGFPPPELSTRPKSTGSPPPELSACPPCLPQPKSSRLPSPILLSSRSTPVKSPPLELSSRAKSTKSLQLELSSKPPSSRLPQPLTSPDNLLLVTSQQPTLSLTEHPQSVLPLTESPEPPPSPSVSDCSLSPAWSARSRSRLIESPRRSQSVSCSEMSSSSLELSPCRGDSPGEGMSGQPRLQGLTCGEETRMFSWSPKVLMVPDSASTSGSDLDPELETGTTGELGLFPEPSRTVHSLAYRELAPPNQYLGLDGFLTLGVELGLVRPNSLPMCMSQEGEDTMVHFNIGPEYWRPSTSFSDFSDEELVNDIMSSQPIRTSPRAATPSRAGFPVQGMRSSVGAGAQSWSGRNTPRSTRPMSSGARSQSSPLPRPLSRAAQEILEIECVDRMESEDPHVGEEEDRQALASLEEEFRLMSRGGATPSCDPLSPPHPGGVVEARRRTRGSKRQESSEGHTDEEEEIRRDKQNVMSLP